MKGRRRSVENWVLFLGFQDQKLLCNSLSQCSVWMLNSQRQKMGLETFFFIQFLQFSSLL